MVALAVLIQELAEAMVAVDKFALGKVALVALAQVAILARVALVAVLAVLARLLARAEVAVADLEILGLPHREQVAVAALACTGLVVVARQELAALKAEKAALVVVMAESDAQPLAAITAAAVLFGVKAM